MKFVYSRYKSKEKLIKIIKRHELHNRRIGSKMLEWSTELSIDDINLVVVVYDQMGKNYIGSAIVINEVDYNTQGRIPCNMGVWVDDSYRRQGIGTQIINILKRETSIKLRPWNRCGIPKRFFDSTLEGLKLIV